MCRRNGSHSSANTRTTGWLSEKLTSRRSGRRLHRKLTKRSDSFRVADHPRVGSMPVSSAGFIVANLSWCESKNSPVTPTIDLPLGHD